MSDESKRLGLDEEEIARLRRESHGVIEGGKPGALPLAPEPTDPGAGTRKGRRPDPPPVDDGATVPVQLMDADALARDVDSTPPPLPPSPAASAAEVWLEEAVTRPSAFAHIASAVGPAPGTPTPVEGSVLVTDPVEAMREAHAQAMRSMRIMLVLSAVTAFTLGLILGMLIFR